MLRDQVLFFEELYKSIGKHVFMPGFMRSLSPFLSFLFTGIITFYTEEAASERQKYQWYVCVSVTKFGDLLPCISTRKEKYKQLLECLA